jgi:AcrR family transcriptional regulator
MQDTDLKNKIKKVAVDLFNKNGYHGATIRNIAKEADCSLPMIYYYFKSKKELFHEIIMKDYFNLLKKQAKQVNASNVLDFYTRLIYQLNYLSDYDKKVYRLGIKVYLTYEGDRELIEIMNRWEKTIQPTHYKLLSSHLNADKDTIIMTRVLIRLMDNLIESIVAKNTYIQKEQIREELAVILQNQ